MNKKLLFSGIVAVALTACTSEEALQPTLNNEASSQMKEVVGAKLASKGMSFGVNNGEETRVNAQGWESTDKVGLAWVDNGVGDITAVQGSALAPFASMADKKIYANTILTTADGGSTFTTMANVYEGAYFVYSPWAYKNQIGELTFTPNATAQTESVDKERYAKLPWISGMQFIAADAKLQKGELNKTYKLNPIANTLRVTATPQGNITTALASYYLANMTVSTNEEVYYDQMTVDPSKMDVNGGDIDGAIVKMLAASTPSTSIATEIDPAYAPCGNAAEVRAFVLPTKVPAANNTQDSKIVFEVKKAAATPIKIGEFRIEQGGLTQTATNTASLKKLNLALNAPQALYAKSLTEILRNDAGKPVALGLPVELTVSNFYVTLFDEISNLAEWNEAVALFDALHQGQTNQTANFTVDGNVVFEGAINVPATAKDVNITTAAGGAMTLKSGNVTMPASIKGDGAMNMTVKAGATLTLASKVEGINYATEVAPSATAVGGTLIVTSSKAVVPFVASENKGITYIKETAAVTAGTPVAAEVPVVTNENGSIVYVVENNWNDDKDGLMTDALDAVSHITAIEVKNAALTYNANSTQNTLPYDLNNATVTGNTNITVGDVTATGTCYIDGKAIAAGAITNNNTLVINGSDAINADAVTNKNTLTINGKKAVTTNAIINQKALTINGTDITVDGIENNTKKGATTVAITTNSKDANTAIAVGAVKNTNSEPGTTEITVSNASQDTSKKGNLTGSKDVNTTLHVNSNVTGTLS